MTARVVVQVVPGGRTTGIAARRGANYLGHELVVRQAPCVFPDLAYPQDVCARVQHWLGRWPNTTVAIRNLDIRRSPTIEELSKDRGGGLIALGQVSGALQGRFPDALIVAPDRQDGANLLAAYPQALVDAEELARLTGDGPLRRCREAWDAAARAHRLLQRAARQRRRPAAAMEAGPGGPWEAG